MIDLLQTLLAAFRDKMSNFSGGITREVSFPELKNIEKILAILGMRRAGKSYLLCQIIQSLLKKVPITRILYVNFDDDRLLPMSQKEFASLIEAFYTLYPENHDHLCYLFFDEIQNVDQWELVLRRFFDSKKVKIYITGSSAKLLNTEIHTSLRGRSFPIELWPFSFEEYLTANQMTISRDLMGQNTLDKLKGHLSSYLEIGGFPESVLLSSFQDRRSILQNYVSTVILRDIVERYKISNASVIQYMAKTLLKNVGCSVSISKFHQDLKSQGYAVGKDNLYNYFDYISDAYLAFSVPIHDESIRKVQTNPKKTYAIDTGLASAYTIGRTENWGHHFENLVYLDLRRRGYTEIAYYLTKTRKEVDFIARDRLGHWRLYQVCWDMADQETLRRETIALEEAMEELGIDGKIITPDCYVRGF